MSMSVVREALAGELKEVLEELEKICQRIKSLSKDVPSQFFPDAMSAENYCEVLLKTIRRFLERVAGEETARVDGSSTTTQQ